MQMNTIGEYEAKAAYARQILSLIQSLETQSPENPLEHLKCLVECDLDVFEHMANLLTEKMANDFPG